MDEKQIMEGEKCVANKLPPMSEERKFAILFAATLLSARKLLPMMEEGQTNMAIDYFTEIYVKKAIEQAAYILEKIDERWPTNDPK
jgi:hypothetical protein